jgi:hypothetical protein
LWDCDKAGVGRLIVRDADLLMTCDKRGNLLEERN